MKVNLAVSCALIKPTSLKYAFGLMIFLFSTCLHATTIILNEANGYQATIELGVTVFRDPLFNRDSTEELSDDELGYGPIIIDGGQFALGTSDMASFPGQTRFGGNRDAQPRNLARNATPFTIRADVSGNLYDAILTYFEGQELGSFGTAPDPLDGATAAFEITLAEPIPIPAAGWLLLSALGTLGFFKKKKTS